MVLDRGEEVTSSPQSARLLSMRSLHIEVYLADDFQRVIAIQFIIAGLFASDTNVLYDDQ